MKPRICRQIGGQLSGRYLLAHQVALKGLAHHVQLEGAGHG